MNNRSNHHEFYPSLWNKTPSKSVIELLIVRLKQWSADRGWQKEQVTDLTNYGPALLERLIHIDTQSETSVVIDKIKKEGLISFMTGEKCKWTKATVTDLCEQVIAPFWEENLKNASVDETEAVAQIVFFTIRNGGGLENKEEKDNFYLGY